MFASPCPKINVAVYLRSCGQVLVNCGLVKSRPQPKTATLIS